MAALGGCGGTERAAEPTTFTLPPGTEPSGSTTPPPVPPTLPAEDLPPRLDRAGFSPGIGIIGQSDADLSADLDRIAELGVRWLRIDVDWPTIQEAGPDSYDWTRVDRVIVGSRERGLDVVGLLAYTPRWARPPGSSDKHPPLDPDRFAVFAAEAARRYAPLGVHTWEIWNEPNTSTFWAPRPDPEGYTELLVRAFAALHAVDPDATVVLGGLSPATDRSDGTRLRDRTFLERVYAAGGGRAFDAVGLHPYSFPALPTDPSEYNTFAGAPALYQVMVDNGDGAKLIWGTEFGAPTRGEGSVSEERQAEMLEVGYRTWVAWDFTGPLLWFRIRDAADAGRDGSFGLVTDDGSPKAAYASLVEIVRELSAELSSGLSSGPGG